MSGRIKSLVGIIAVIGFTIGLHQAGRLLFLEKFFRRLIGMGIGTAYQLTIKVGENETFHSVEELQGAYMAAKKQLLEARIQAVRATLLDEENKKLREQLKFFTDKPARHIGADVIGRNTEPTDHTLILNRGSNDGILSGQPVIVENGILIGKITRAEPDMSVVRLLSDGQSKVAATILNQDHSVGLVEGGYGISVQMNLIPQHETVSRGDVIVTSGLESGIPRGLLIGMVEAVEKEAYQPFQRAALTPFASLDRLAAVSVILSDTSVTKL